MKRVWLLCVMACYTGAVFAQDSSFHAFGEEPQSTEHEDVIKAKLVALALQNADKKIADYQVEAARQRVGLAKASWISTITASSYWNEFSINPPSKDQVNFYYPKYNFGISVPLSIFITVPKNIKIAKADYHISQEEQKLKALTIKNQVLSKYEDYLMYKKQLTIQSIVAGNEYNAFHQVENKFRSGEVSITDYSKEMQIYNTELSKKISLQHDLAVSKLAIEEMIGTSLENVIH